MKFPLVQMRDASASAGALSQRFFFFLQAYKFVKHPSADTLKSLLERLCLYENFIHISAIPFCYKIKQYLNSFKYIILNRENKYSDISL